MIKRKIGTMSMAAFFMLCNALVGQLWIWGFIEKYPYWARAMFITTSVYVLCGCMLQTFGYLRSSRALGGAAFLILCIAVFYSTRPYEYIIFGGCICTVLHRMSHTCECIRDQENQRKCDNEGCPLVKDD